MHASSHPSPPPACYACACPLLPERDMRLLLTIYPERCVACHAVARSEHQPSTLRVAVWGGPSSPLSAALQDSRDAYTPERTHSLLCVPCYLSSHSPTLNQASVCSICGSIAAACHRILVTTQPLSAPRASYSACDDDHLRRLIAELTPVRLGWCPRCDYSHTPAGRGATLLIVGSLRVSSPSSSSTWTAWLGLAPTWRWEERTFMAEQC
jgi:hypothetical protein